jgi:trehalose 6-phosphate synthase
MQLALRFGIPLAAVLLIMAFLLTPLTQLALTHWFRGDVDIRSKLIWNSIEQPLSRRLAVNDEAGVVSLFNAVARDERVLALALCSASGQLMEHSVS